MKKAKKLLAVLSAVLISSFAMVTSASAIFRGVECKGVYYSAEEFWEIIDKSKQIKLEIDKDYLLEIPDQASNVALYKYGTNNDLIDTNSELYKFLKTYKFDILDYNYLFDMGVSSSDVPWKENEFGVILIAENGETSEELCRKLEEFPEIISACSETCCMFEMNSGTEIDVVSGDLSMDGKVNIVDAVKLAKYNADPTAFPLLTYSQLAADINGDGELTNADLVALIQMI